MLMRPRLLRPPVRRRGSVSAFSGVDFVISSKVRVVMKRRPADVGLYFLSGICPIRSPSGLVEELDHLLALLQDHVGLLPIRPAAHVAALPLDLAVHVGHPHVLDLHPEQALHGLLDLGLGGVPVDLEAERALGLLEGGGLLGDERPPDDLVKVLHGVRRSSSLPRASCETSRVRQSSTSYTFSCVVSTTFTPGMLRPESTSASGGSWSTITALPSIPSWTSRPFSTLVFGSSMAKRSMTFSPPSLARWLRAERRAALLA